MKIKHSTLYKMKATLILLSSSFVGHSQQGLEILPAIFTSTLPEIQSLRAIEDDQQYVADATKNIAYKSAGIYLMKTAEYEEMSNVSNRLEDSPKVERIANMAAEVYVLYQETTELINAYPNVDTISLEDALLASEILLQILADLDLVLTGGGDNLMDTVDRLKLVDGLEKDLSQLLQSVKLLKDLTLADILTETQILEITIPEIEPLNLQTNR